MEVEGDVDCSARSTAGMFQRMEVQCLSTAIAEAQGRPT